MTEKLLQFIWKNRYFIQEGLELISGEPVSIEYSGEENTHQGPDFIMRESASIKTIGWAALNCIFFHPDG